MRETIEVRLHPNYPTSVRDLPIGAFYKRLDCDCVFIKAGSIGSPSYICLENGCAGRHSPDLEVEVLPVTKIELTLDNSFIFYKEGVTMKKEVE